MAEHNELGKAGEEKACEYLQSIGYKIIARNWRFRQKEVDIIAYDGEVLAVVEVRTRTTSGWEHPRDTLTPSKIRFLVIAADEFINQKKIDSRTRFDIVTCMPTKDGDWDVSLIKGAFTAQAE